MDDYGIAIEPSSSTNGNTFNPKHDISSVGLQGNRDDSGAVLEEKVVGEHSSLSACNPLGYVSVIAFAINVSFAFAGLRCFVFTYTHVFDPRDFGAISGFIRSAGGVASLASVPLYSVVSVDLLDGNCLPVTLGLSAYMFTAVAALYAIHRLKLQRQRHSTVPP